jgi:hypothetical protein
MVDRLTAAEATAQIVSLINSRPATPWPREIEAIIARVTSTSAPASLSLPPHVVAYRERAQAYYHHSVKVLGPLPDNAPDDHPEWVRNAALSNEVEVAAAPILQGPVDTWGDIVGLASIVVHEQGHDLDALGERKVDQGHDPGIVAPEALALAVLRLHARAVPQLAPVDPELVRLISAWRRQRDIVDGTIYETHGRGHSYEDYKPYEATIGNATAAASDLAQQIWERAKAETWSGGPVNPLTLAALAEIAFQYENGATNTLPSDGDGCFDEKSFAELMVGVLAFARSAGVGSDLLPMEGRFLPPALLNGSRPSSTANHTRLASTSSRPSSPVSMHVKARRHVWRRQLACSAKSRKRSPLPIRTGKRRTTSANGPMPNTAVSNRT